GSGSSGNGSGGDGGAVSAIASAMNLVFNFGRAFSGRGITAQLGFLEGNGLARVLAKPTLVAHTGQTASFLAGGEIPVPVPSGNSNNISIQYKEFGVKLQLTPTILSDERVALKVAPEASDLDHSQGVTINGVSVPALRTRRADTMVELGDGESFIIGGLVSRSTLSSVNKVPLLGDLPILGAFFKNLNYSQEETELVIIVTPHLVQPLPPGTNLEAMLPGGRQERPNADQVWAPYIVGAPYANSAVPGFSY
ncbi:MAG: type II and III secretion system protein family protein, partial [Comamonas sp.]